MKDIRGAIGIQGLWGFKCRKSNGDTKWVVDVKNIVTTAGINHILDTEFHNAAQVPTWYIGLKSAGEAAAGDTLVSHANWTEVTNYTGNRKEYVEAAAASGVVTNNNNKASFAINANNTVIAGGFLCSAENGTSGTLFSAVDFTGGNKTCDDGDTLEVTYTISANNV